MSAYRWFELGDGRRVFRRVPERQATRSDLPTPMLIRDAQEPLRSMADGKIYTSKSAMRRSYRADGNPQCVEYVEVGNEDLTTFKPPKRDHKADRDAIERAVADVDAGRAPPVLTTDEHKL